MACEEYTIEQYLECQNGIPGKIAAIELLITKNILLIAATMDGAGGNISMYELDDSQVRIKTNYRSVDDIIRANTSLKRMKSLFEAELYGRKTVLRDRGTLIRGRC